MKNFSFLGFCGLFLPLESQKTGGLYEKNVEFNCSTEIAEMTERLRMANVFVKPNEQSEACFDSAMARKRRMQSNVFVKPNEQSEACFDSAMARKRRMQSNVFVKLNELSEACFDSAMARKRRMKPKQ